MDDFTAAAAAFPDPFRLLVREEAVSTNDETTKLAVAGAPEGLVLLAMRQTGGRGRRGAAWFAPAGQSLAFSILLRPAAPKVLWPRLALAAGLAVAEAMEDFGLSPGIKWPNDIWLGGRKAAGVLVEAGADFAVVGIGINVNATEFPEALADVATSMQLAAAREIALPEALGGVTRHFALRSRQIGADFPELIGAIRERCVLRGQRVSLLTAGGALHGMVEDIADGGELLLRSHDRLHRILQADEVRILDR